MHGTKHIKFISRCFKIQYVQFLFCIRQISFKYVALRKKNDGLTTQISH